MVALTRDEAAQARPPTTPTARSQGAVGGSGTISADKPLCHEDAMSDERALTTLADQINELTVEIAMLRESIVTAAEWDNESRQARQQVLDAALAAARIWLRVLIGVNMLLVVLVIWLLARAGA